MEQPEAMRKATRNRRLLLIFLSFDLLVVFVLGVLWWLGVFKPRGTATPTSFDGQRALDFAVAQTDLGPRTTGTPGGLAAGDLIKANLDAAGWATEFQTFEYQGTVARNVIGRANVGRGPVIILGAHYDTRRRADQDEVDPSAPVIGANDGASGVAVLLELAQTLDLDRVPNEIWLAFFDAEDNGDLDGWDWIIGSRYMADHLDRTDLPQSMILVDMIGDTDQQFYLDSNSDAALSAQLWTVAAQLGYNQHFIPLPRYAMLDDHIPFRELGIPAVDIIDFDYPYWHTTQDTADKLSADSLERVGRTLEAFLESPEP